MSGEGRQVGLTSKVTPIRFGEGPNDWARWDLPMLKALHRALDEDPARPHHVRLSVLVPTPGVDEADLPWLDRAIERLVTAGYITSPPQHGGGRRRSVMVAAAAEVEPYSPEEASKMRDVGRFLERQLQTGITGLTSGLGSAIGKALVGG